MQNYAQLQPSNINIALEPVSGDPFKSKPFTYKLRFENKTQGLLNGNNWVIYFNKGGSNKAPDFVKDYAIERVNGVLYQIKPNSGFANVLAGDSFEILMQSSGPIMNKSDLPNGFFIHYLNENKFFNLQNPKVLNEPTANMMFRSVHDALPVQTPALIYENNKRFSTITAAELSPILPTPSAEIIRSQGFHTLNAAYQIIHNGEWLNEIQHLKTQLDPFFSKSKKLLDQLEGLIWVELERSDECCGFGGTFAITEEALSIQMGKDRIEDHLKSGAEILISGDISCIMHLKGIAKRNNQPIEFMHIAEILNKAIL